MPAAPATIETLLRQAAAIDRVDAEWLLAHALGQSRTWLMAHSGDVVAEAAAVRFADLLARRAAGEPVAYLTGVQGFWTLDLEEIGRAHV